MGRALAVIKNKIEDKFSEFKRNIRQTYIMRAQTAKEKLVDPLLVLLAFGVLVILASIGVFNPVIVGFVGLALVFLLFIEPYLEKAGIIQNSEQKFLYTVMCLALALFLYGGITSGKIPVLGLTNFALLNISVSILLYILVIILIVAFILNCLFSEKGYKI